MLKKENLTDLLEWRMIEDRLNRLRKDYTDEVLDFLAKGEINKALERGGRINMILDVLNMPESEFPPPRKEG